MLLSLQQVVHIAQVSCTIDSLVLKLQWLILMVPLSTTHKIKSGKAHITHLNKKTALNIVDACYDLSVNNLMAEVQDNVFLDKYDKSLLDIFLHSSEELPYKIGSLRKELKEDPTSLLIYPREEHIDELRNLLDDQHAELIEHRKWGAPWNIIEIVKKGMNKAVGLQKNRSVL